MWYSNIGKVKIMKLKTKLMITCLAMILIPLVLTCLTFVGVGNFMVQRQDDFRQVITQEIEDKAHIDIGKIIEEPMDGFEKIIAPNFLKNMIFSIIVILVFTSVIVSLLLYRDTPEDGVRYFNVKCPVPFVPLCILDKIPPPL